MLGGLVWLPLQTTQAPEPALQAYRRELARKAAEMHRRERATKAGERGVGGRAKGKRSFCQLLFLFLTCLLKADHLQTHRGLKRVLQLPQADI